MVNLTERRSAGAPRQDTDRPKEQTRTINIANPTAAVQAVNHLIYPSPPRPNLPDFRSIRGPDWRVHYYFGDKITPYCSPSRKIDL
jgi:hypothetical protein